MILFRYKLNVFFNKIYKKFNINFKNSIIALSIIFFVLRLNTNIEIKSISILIVSTIYFLYKPQLVDFELSSFKFPIIFLFTFLIITQNQFLNYEMVSLDTPSYLVASQKVGINELPFQNQWESKGPLFLYLYNFLSFLSNENLILFKIINDLLLFLITLILFLTIFNKNKVISSAFLGSLFFLSIVSYIWYHSEFSEIYCLLLISYHFYFVENFELNNKNILYASMLLSLSTLINQATFIFYLSFFILIILKRKRLLKIREIASLFLGLAVPHTVFIILYSISGFLNVYVSNYLIIPLSYVGSDRFKFNELFVWLKRYSEYNEFLFFAIIFFIAAFLIQVYKSKSNLLEEKDLINTILYLIPAFLIYVIAGHSYEHHLFYFIYFSAVLTELFIKDKKINIANISIVLCSLQIFMSSFTISFNNLTNLEKLYVEYPLYQVSKEIDSKFENKNYTVLAFDHVLILHYLQKQNVSYLVHPLNNFEDYIVDELINLDLLKTNESSHFSYYIEKEPDVIICSPQSIIDGNPVKFEDYNCEITDYKKNYYKLDTQFYEENRLREYFFDPYKEIRVYIKKP
tara:strand:+ start:1005 stop:2729 length:1725 start_codon:yes stop_codon:yes gene_type:complete